MIKRILEQEPAIRQIFGLDRKCTHLIPAWQDLEVLESIKTALDHLSDFTDVLSGEDYVTVYSVKLLLHHLTSEICLQEELLPRHCYPQHLRSRTIIHSDQWAAYV